MKSRLLVGIDLILAVASASDASTDPGLCIGICAPEMTPPPAEPLNLNETIVGSCAGPAYAINTAPGESILIEIDALADPVKGTPPLSMEVISGAVTISKFGDSFRMPITAEGASVFVAAHCVSGEIGIPPVSYTLRARRADAQALTVQTAPGAVVSAYEAVSGIIRESAVADSTGMATLNVTSGNEYRVQAMRGAVSIWAGRAPREKSSAVKPDRLIKIPLGTSAPMIAGVNRNGGSVTLTGSGFGSIKGYIDFGGYISKAKTDDLWAKTEDSITVNIPAKAIPGCLRVFSKTGGWSRECVSY
jgi:hypothetical protein